MPVNDLETVLARVDDNLPTSLDTLFDLLRIKSISTDPDFAGDCRKAADFLAAYLETLGFSASVRNTEGHPVVLAHHAADHPGRPHVLFYGHYDVQPVDPLNLWDTDPFEPQLRQSPKGDKVIAARGANDDKGQLMTFVEAIRAYKDIRGTIPLNLTILFEGEEEAGSKSLPAFLRDNVEALKGDFAMVCDTGMWDRDTPSICAGLRGMVSEEIIVHAANRDLHSGGFGGLAANPIHIVSTIVAGLHDATGAITLDGFYDGVAETPPELKAKWASLEGTQEDMMREVGLSIPVGEKGRSMLELNWARPTAEVNGITGGYQGQGFKTVIAAQASAKISFRLVGKQNPAKIRDSFRAYVEKCIPDDCSVEFIAHGSAAAVQLPYESPLLSAAKTALSDEWQKPAIVTGGGGSIPIVGDFQSTLGMDSLLVGFGLSDDNGHSPNEKYNLTSFHKGIRSWIRIIDAVSGIKGDVAF
ncbi:dipeptidase [Martelella alba]|uniref:Dipeptidase n=1 Tax=Martelella alba TaxID=2590451 RepID=A0A506U6S7_9HYPH|nr:dipeptidase [Martelella alba]TPW29208.1 dipeptidase [Martelella alba]